ncbi:unnamed protein product [Acanthoscelides obtectus]|uniref:Peptide-N(4)-(N-acetyl-beta-glucosaminyl)asparagine amidase n=3 Tax=Acanthoscelides obtectus TaxID=200917 RepID=A0A9P0P5B4_ACAOB|nr:unnamed protein product [Acanthoscelides obtectus]CAK1632572.1 Peptide-N(4)-(N-acetyl-beta-glucosaminyl)asparagine amidase [Acanthoscelides obtectus]
MMGFKENATNFTMPSNTSLESVMEFREILVSWNNSILRSEVPASQAEKQAEMEIAPSAESVEEIIKPVALPPLVQTYSNPFLRRIEMYAHNVLQYEDKNLRGRCRKLIPVTLLEYNAQERLRSIQKLSKKDKLLDVDVSLQDMIILELLSWFKNYFFTWVDCMECKHCGGETAFSHMSTDPKLLVYTERIELHRCRSCHEFTPFPRYTDLNILLETRRGRCGEWANTFTLCCRAMNWDARFVVEENDHVWTEVYSITQKRWLHCDPCENICDTPLIYETGWNKNISYVIAYSAEEVQDVTWRYSSNHKEVLKRRKNCLEAELLDALLEIRDKKQKELSESRKEYLTKRMLMEVVEFLVEKKPNDVDNKGRISGSAAWKLTRGEIQSEVKSHIWSIHSNYIGDSKTVTIKYCCSQDKYECSADSISINGMDWSSGAFSHESVFRKVEEDWKMAYICRKDGEEKGTLTWKLDVGSNQRGLKSLDVFFDYTTFENGAVDVTICSEHACYILPKGEKQISLSEMQAAREITITAVLKGGKGDCAWQHAQLFRQHLDSSEYPFSITLTFE